MCWLITLNFEPQELVVPSLSLQRSSSSFCRLLWLIISFTFDWKEVSRKRKLKVISKLLDKTRKKNRLNYLFLNPALLLILSPWFSWTKSDSMMGKMVFFLSWGAHAMMEVGARTCLLGSTRISGPRKAQRKSRTLKTLKFDILFHCRRKSNIGLIMLCIFNYKNKQRK